jgi:DNA polymerase I
MLISELLEKFDEVWLHDFEFAVQPGERPDVVCLAALELRGGRTLRLWRDKLGDRPPYRTDNKVLFVNFVANAEISCHLALGWPVPRNVLDLNPVFRNLTNGRATPEGKGLIGVLRYFGVDTLDAKRKAAMRQRVMRGWPFTPEEREQILSYCLSDVQALAQVLPLILPEIDLGIALYHGEFAAASAGMEHAGVPINAEVFQQLADPEVWRAVRDEMVPVVDAQYDVYARNAAGDWAFSMERWEAYLKREGLHNIWPRPETGALNMRRKTFEDMTKAFPQLEGLRQLRHTRDKMRKIKLAVGSDNRNRTVLWPFKAKTSRTQPKASEWIFSPAVWLRSLIKPTPGMAVAYVDYSSMEFLLAASLSDGHCGPINAMLEMYQSGDPYLSFAKTVGAVPQSATKQSHTEVRDRYKVMLLATQYGMSAETLAARLNVSTFEAHEMLGQHREQFSQYWRWSDDYITQALQTGKMSTAFGWTYHIGIVGQINERSLRNWPIQSAGGDVLRISCILAARHGLRILAPVHDAILIEAPVGRIEADVALMQEIMRRASRIVLNATAGGTHELRTDASIVRYPDHYSDKRGDAIYAHVLELVGTHTQLKRERHEAKGHICESAALVDRAGHPGGTVTATSLRGRVAVAPSMASAKHDLPRAQWPAGQAGG